MHNFEGIKITEASENEMEQESVRVFENFDPDNFDDCSLTEKEKLLRVKQELQAMCFAAKNSYV